MRGWIVVVLALSAIASGCDEQGGPSPVDRQSITTAFSRIGEPLKMRLDLQGVDPDSSAAIVDAIYIPASAEASRKPFEVALFDDEEGTRERALWMESVTGGTIDIVRWKNVIITFWPSVSLTRRDKLVATLMSL